jgi:AMP-binding enzyme
MKVSETGEVLAGSNVVLDGYWDKPPETAVALEGGWFHTGDGGRIDESHGHLTIYDRKKDVIVTGGRGDRDGRASHGGRGRHHRPLQAAHGRLQGADECRVP